VDTFEVSKTRSKYVPLPPPLSLLFLPLVRFLGLACYFCCFGCLFAEGEGRNVAVSTTAADGYQQGGCTVEWARQSLYRPQQAEQPSRVPMGYKWLLQIYPGPRCVPSPSTAIFARSRSFSHPLATVALPQESRPTFCSIPATRPAPPPIGNPQRVPATETLYIDVDTSSRIRLASGSTAHKTPQT
jgi:hypothetical protein